ncbi:MAG: RDD family protein [Burkholderiales bacterium]|nr:RDD family protein [Burkholderiales bacterium]
MKEVELDNFPTPTLRRRLICMVYESVLLFGVGAVSIALFMALTVKLHGDYLQQAKMSWLFFSVGLYFCYSWCRGGQTLAMKTWRIRVVDANGNNPDGKTAAIRYALAWMWFMPALVLHSLLHLDKWPSVIALCVGFIVWACFIWLNPERQFLHDRIAGTRLILLDKPNVKKADANASPAA